MLRLITIDDVPRIAAIHNSSWASHELSVKLGPAFQKDFYRNVARSPIAFGYVYEDAGHLISYATGMSDYASFNQQFSMLELGKISIKRLLQGKMTAVDILNSLSDHRKFRKLHYPRYHLGALALANEYKSTRIGRTAMETTIGAVIRQLQDRGASGCWTATDMRNKSMREYLNFFGFAHIDIVNYIGKDVAIYEKLMV